jgi:predicted methyltransferase
MGNLRFYHLYIVPKKQVDSKEIARTLAESTDSVQYDPNNFVLYTMFDAKEWYARLAKYVEPGGKMFICQLDKKDYWGYMNNGLWKLLKK